MLYKYILLTYLKKKLAEVKATLRAEPKDFNQTKAGPSDPPKIARKGKQGAIQDKRGQTKTVTRFTTQQLALHESEPDEDSELENEKCNRGQFLLIIKQPNYVPWTFMDVFWTNKSTP